MHNYTPSEKILKNLSDVLIKFALNSGKGINPGEVVYVMLNEWAKPILLPIQRSILESGGHMILCYLPGELQRDRDETRQFYELANDEQLRFFPESYIKARIDLVDHFVLILSSGDNKYYEGVDQQKIAERNKVYKRYYEMRSEKEYSGKLTWVLTEYPTPERAKAANLAIEEYWEQVIRACYLDHEDPIGMNRLSMDSIRKIVDWLNNLNIRQIRITGEDVDLQVGLSSAHQFVGGSGRNVPSFEVFTSPDKTKTNGWIKFNQPLYLNGQIINGIKLFFKEGKVVDYTASENLEGLKALIETDEGAMYVGEFSLTDKRFSRINKIMANTLYDENFGGDFGNMHIALGQSYKDAIKNHDRLSSDELIKLGFNKSAIHTDIISTSNREAVVTLSDGTETCIYKDGQFTMPL